MVRALHSPTTLYENFLQTLATNAVNTWSIDGTVLTVNGALYFVYSAFSPAGLQSLYIAPMTNAYTLGARSVVCVQMNELLLTIIPCALQLSLERAY